MVRLFSFCLVSAMSAFLITGCSTPKEAAATPAIEIRKGSPTEDLVAVMGEPQSIEVSETGPQPIEIWTYRKKSKQTDLVAFRTKEVPYVDPLTGVQRTIQEPDYQPQITTRTQIVKVYVVDGKVMGWKFDEQEKQDIVE